MAEFIRVSTGGSHRDMGVDFGRAAKDVLRAFIEDSRAEYPRRAKMRVADAKRHAARHLLPTVRRRYPKYLLEIEGMAEGAGLALDDFFYLTADEEIISLGRRREKCSSAAVRSGDRFFLGHNEDYPSLYLGRLVIVEARPDDAPSFLALTYPYILAGPSCGLNASGLAFAANSLNFPPRAVGLPTNFVLRDVYGSRSLADVRRAMRVRGALMGNALVAVSSGERSAIAVEASPDNLAVLTMGTSGLLAHANHVCSEKLDRSGEKPSRSSLLRLAALQRVLAAPKLHTAAGLQRALSSAKDGLCRVTRRKGGDCTLASAVLDPKRRMLYVAKRGPKGHGFKPYRLA